MRIVVVAVIALIAAFQWASKKYKADDALAWALNNPNHKYSDDVEYYTGLFYYQRADYPKAQAAFSQMLVHHTTMSVHIGKALVRLEDSAEGNHDWETARLAVDKYFELREDYFPNDKFLDIMNKRNEGLKMKGK